jgi:hypothetical protein
MNKYHAKKCKIDGRWFDSIAEAEHYLVLKDRQKRGMIYGLECQKRFVVVKAQTHEGKRVQEVVYIADFAYYDAFTKKLVVEDVKGSKKGAAYQIFTIKKKLLLQEYGIWVNEV